MELPSFRYHPDPLATGSVKQSNKTCLCCNKARGFIYRWSPYCEQELDHESICPWCIADGTAHMKFGASFVSSIGDFEEGGAWSRVPREVLNEIEFRTPGFVVGKANAGGRTVTMLHSLLDSPGRL